MIRYINWRCNGEIETIDELDSKDYPTTHQFRVALTTLLSQHRMYIRDGYVYTSRRCNKHWKN